MMSGILFGSKGFIAMVYSLFFNNFDEFFDQDQRADWVWWDDVHYTFSLVEHDCVSIAQIMSYLEIFWQNLASLSLFAI